MNGMLGILVKSEIMEEWLIQWEKAENVCKFAICLSIKRKKNVEEHCRLFSSMGNPDFKHTLLPHKHTHALTLLL